MTDELDGLADEAAFRDLFAATYAAVLAYARRRSFDISDADDVVGDVYAIAWRRRASLEAGSPPLPWLYGIASNVMLNRWRANGRRKALEERIAAQPFPNQADKFGTDPAESDAHDLRLAMAKMSFEDQEVLRLVAWEGLGHAEVGQILNCSANAVGIRIHRAKQRLKTELQHLKTELHTQENSQPDQPRGGAAQ